MLFLLLGFDGTYMVSKVQSCLILFGGISSHPIELLSFFFNFEAKKQKNNLLFPIGYQK